MGRIIHNTEASLSGKVGNMVYVQDHGATYLRTVPKRTKDSWTPKQLQHRRRFSKVNAFCNKFKRPAIRGIWNLASPSNRGYSLFVKANMPAFDLEGELIDARMLQISTGKLILPRQLKAERQAEGASLIAVSWMNDANLVTERLNDELMTVSGNATHYSDVLATGLHRSDLRGTFELPFRPLNVTHVFLYFASRGGQDFSDSMCFEVEYNKIER